MVNARGDALRLAKFLPTRIWRHIEKTISFDEKSRS
jgi:hypothetical protein